MTSACYPGSEAKPSQNEYGYVDIRPCPTMPALYERRCKNGI